MYQLVFVLKIALNHVSESCRNMTLPVSNVGSCESSVFSKPNNRGVVKFFVNSLCSILNNRECMVQMC